MKTLKFAFEINWHLVLNIYLRIEFESTKGSYNLAKTFLIQNDFFVTTDSTWFLILLIFTVNCSYQKSTKLILLRFRIEVSKTEKKYYYWFWSFFSTLIIFVKICPNVVGWSLKFRFSEKVKKFEKNLPLDLTLLSKLQNRWEIFQIFVAFSQYLNFKGRKW